MKETTEDSIKRLNLSTKTFNALRLEGHTTISGLALLSFWDILLIPNFGPVATNELIRELDRLYHQGTLERLVRMS
jgi:DNA-directed RNA polymerase alpha subunit